MVTTLLVLFGVLNVVDMVTTYIGMNNGAKELNLALKYLFKKIGVIPSLVINKAFLLVLVYWMCAAHWFNPLTTICVLVFLTVLYIAVVINNLKILKELSVED